jgi:tetratricopeptide (TPR) repeat protein
VRRLLTVLLLLAAAPLAVAAVEDDLADARLAVEQGRLDDAVYSYRKVLIADPDHQEALRELAKVLSWQGGYEEPVVLYQRALKNDPDDPDALVGLARTYAWNDNLDEALPRYYRYLDLRPEDDAVRLEAAKVRSWSGDYGPVIALYEAHLRAHPEDEHIRLELAKVLSWSGRLDESVREYDAILASDPGSTEARIGLARTESWSGDLGAAERGYDTVLEENPKDAAALLGKAQISYWRGEPRAAQRYLDRAEAAAPGAEDVAAFRAEIRRSRTPYLDARVDGVRDTDGNNLRVFRLAMTSDLNALNRITGVYRNSATEFQGARATVHHLGAIYRHVLPKEVALSVIAGVDFVRPSTGDDTQRLVGGLRGEGPFATRWNWNAGVERRSFDALLETVDNNITYDITQGGVDGKVGNWGLGGSTGFADFSDGNDRTNVTVYTRRPWDWRLFDFTFTYRFVWMGYAENLASGYFDPQRFTSNVVSFTFQGRLGTPKVLYTVRLETGLQSFQEDPNTVDVGGVPVFLPGGEADLDGVFGAWGQIVWNVTRHFRIQAYYGETTYALQSSTGFRSTQAGIVFGYRF